MTLWLALRRLLPLLAVLSLALTPVTAPAAIAGMHASMANRDRAAVVADHGMSVMDHTDMDHHGAGSADMAGMDMDDMPCCPKAKSAKPDCSEGCPLMALCMAGAASLPPVTAPVPIPVAKRASQSWSLAASFANAHGTRLPEPPRA